MKLRQQRYGVCTASVQKGRKERQLYVRTLEPLIPQASALLQALAGQHGRTLNASAIGRRLGVSPPTVRRRVGLLQELGLVRLLEHVPAEIADGPRRRPAPYLCRSWPVGRMPSARAPRPRPLFRRPRRPRVFLRDPRLVGVTEAADDRIFRGRLIERLIALQQALRPQSRFWYWSVPEGCGIDLVVETEPGRRIGFQLRRAYFTCRIVAVVPCGPFLARYGEWAGLSTNLDVLDALGRIGQSRNCP